MGAFVIPAVIAFLVVGVALVGLEWYFATQGQRARADQEHVEGHDAPPKSL